jgi:small multidrug resistance family-3 protein
LLWVLSKRIFEGEKIMVNALFLFVLAGLAEIGGGYLIWLWLRESKPFWYGILGGVILVIYGIIPTLQKFPNFGRVYAAYGGIFIFLAILWGWLIDKKIPDQWDWIGTVICLVGVSIMLWAPRH